MRTYPQFRDLVVTAAPLPNAACPTPVPKAGAPLTVGGGSKESMSQVRLSPKPVPHIELTPSPPEEISSHEWWKWLLIGMVTVLGGVALWWKLHN